MRIIKNIINNEYGKHLLTLFSGTGAAQLISILIYPIVSRLFLPENFGTLATVTQIASVSAVIASCKYEMNILLCKDDKSAINLMAFIICLSACTLLLLYSIFYVFIDFLSNKLHDNTLQSIAPIPFISAFFIVIYQTFNEWCVRKKFFNNLSMNKIINSSSISICEFILGLYKVFQSASLVMGDMLGRMVSAYSCFMSFMKKYKHLLKEISMMDMKQNAKKACDCPKYLLPAQLLNTLGQALPVFMLGLFFNQTDVGYFSMAFMVVIIPTSVISIAFRDVFRQKAIEMINEGKDCRHLFISNFKILSVLSLIIFGILFIIAPELFSFILGKEWIESGYITRLLAPMIAVSFVTEALSAMMIVSRKMNYQFYWQILYFILTFISLFLGSYTHSLYCMIAVFSIGRITAYISSFIICYRLSLTCNH